MCRFSLSRLSSNTRRRSFLVFLCLCSVLLTGGVFAQTDNTSVTGVAGDVNRAGYSLKPIGLAVDEWPKLRLDFSIEREDKTTFRNLTLADVESKHDGIPIRLKEGDLKLTATEGSAVLILLDGSGSMAGFGVDKMRAAKEGLKLLVDSLGPKDRVCVVVFDEESRVVIPVTSDKELLKREIDAYTIRKDKSRFTRLYDAVDFGMREAKKNQIKNLLLISDGQEDTPETRGFSPAELDRFKQKREQGITDFSRSNDIRVFTVAIGDEHGKGLSYVDRASLSNISKGANGGDGAYLELTEASSADSLQQDVLKSRLQQTLANLRQSFSYSYSLTIQLDESQRDNREHKVWVGFTVGDGQRVQLPVESTYAFSRSGAAVVKDVKKQSPIFIQSAPKTVKWPQLLFIYVLLLSGLLVMAIVPATVRRLIGGGKALRMHKAIVKVTSQSPLIGSICPNEGTEAGRLYLIKEGDVVLVCPNPDCRTPHHLSCWRFNENHCMKRTCELEVIVPPSVLEKYGVMERESV